VPFIIPHPPVSPRPFTDTLPVVKDSLCCSLGPLVSPEPLSATPGLGALMALTTLCLSDELATVWSRTTVLALPLTWAPAAMKPFPFGDDLGFSMAFPLAASQTLVALGTSLRSSLRFACPVVRVVTVLGGRWG
jgi:hypothetical protein